VVYFQLFHIQMPEESYQIYPILSLILLLVSSVLHTPVMYTHSQISRIIIFTWIRVIQTHAQRYTLSRLRYFMVFFQPIQAYDRIVLHLGHGCSFQILSHYSVILPSDAIYSIIRKSLWYFRTLRYSSWDGHDK
jgi:hypothetical protein